MCGSNCDAFCDVLEQVCASDFAAHYADPSECSSDCQDNFPDLGSYDVSMSAGDSVQCRLWHLAAATVDPNLHCQHAAGAAPCAP